MKKLFKYRLCEGTEFLVEAEDAIDARFTAFLYLRNAGIVEELGETNVVVPKFPETEDETA